MDGPQHDEARDDGDLQLQPLTSVRRTRPQALWAVLALVALVAGAVAVANLDGDEDAAGAPALPIALLDRSARSEAGAASDSSLAWSHYVAGPDLPALGGTAPAYRLGKVTEDDVRHLADALGVEGDPHRQGGQWSLQDGDHALGVSEAGGAWWFRTAAIAGGGSDGCGPGADCAPPECSSGAACDPVTTTIEGECSAPNVECAAPTPAAGPATCDAADGACEGDVGSAPSQLPPDAAPCAKVVSVECGTAPDPDLPSKDAAEAIARSLLAKAGLDLGGATVTVDGGVSLWVVSVEAALDGAPSGLVSQVLVGAEGEVQSAGGFLAEPEHLGDYPALTTHATIDRANAGAGQGVPLPAPDLPVGAADDIAVDQVAPDDAEPLTTATTSTAAGPCKPQPSGIEICEQIGSDTGSTTGSSDTPDIPVATTPDEPPAITLTHAVRSTMLIGAIDGTGDLYLVPAYRFTQDGSSSPIDLVAVSDQALAPTPTTETVPATDVPPPSPSDPSCEALVEEDSSGTTHTIQPCPPSAPTEPADPVVLPKGAEPEIGVGYSVDVTVAHCSVLEFAGTHWVPIDVDPASAGWATPTEGGTFTLETPEVGHFRGDAAGTKVGTFERHDEPLVCA